MASCPPSEDRMIAAWVILSHNTSMRQRRSGRFIIAGSGTVQSIGSYADTL